MEKIRRNRRADRGNASFYKMGQGGNMRGISEERLIEELESYDIDTRARDILNGLIDECQELNPWRAIESAPKDREILVYAPSYQDLRPLISVCKWHDSAGFCIDELRQPSHYCELPEPPK